MRAIWQGLTAHATGCASVSAVSASLLLALLLARGTIAQSAPALITNEQILEALAAPLDLDDPRAVFSAVFAQLDDEVTVYPTENYYYFRLWAAGKEVWGSFALPARSRDEGVLSFGYRGRDAASTQGRDDTTVGGGALFTARDGVMVRAVSELVYDVEFEGRTIRFRLNPTVLAAPHDVPLAAGERYVGPVFDESGLPFHLLFDERESHLFLILDERGPVPETFGARGADLLLGERTAFAFWLEEAPRRKVLIGVSGEHVIANDWLDGPFDQMPDNAVGLGRIPDYQRLVEASYPAARGNIDRFGYYLDDEGTRVAVAPYLVYFDDDDIPARAQSCRSRAASSNAFRACITRPGFRRPAATTAQRTRADRKEDGS